MLTFSTPSSSTLSEIQSNRPYHTITKTRRDHFLFLPSWSFRSTLGLAVAAMLLIFTNYGQAFAQEQPGSSSTLPDTLSENYRNWRVNCTTVQNASLICEAQQELRFSENNQRILTISVQALNNEEGGTLTIISPLGVRLEDGIQVAIDEVTATIPYRICMPSGCIAQSSIEERVIAAMMSAENAQFTIVGDTNQSVGIVVSLSGFTAAWNRLGELPR